MFFMKTTVLIIIIFFLFFIARAIGLQNVLDPNTLREFLANFGVFAPFAFAIIYFLATLAMLSAAVLSVLAGVLFGNTLGILLVITAATAAASVAFFLTHFFGKNIFEKSIKKNAVVASLVQRTEKELQTGGFRAFFILRCLFLPYIPLSYAAGLVKTARARDFFWATLITNCIFSPFFVILGDSLTLGWKSFILPFFLIIIILFIPKLIKHLRKKD